MTKYYKVLKDTFMWEKDAIISNEDDSGRYQTINTLFDKDVDLKEEYISSRIIEHKNNSDFFVEVFPVNGLKKTVYLVKEEAKRVLLACYK